jgi:3D-(3,5/4)-trihydroxycyclohexane-1,2-dione acylhydrolase (decyclizing)
VPARSETQTAADRTELVTARVERAQNLARYGSLEAALSAGVIAAVIDVSLSEALVLGLLRQGVTTYLTVLGHGSTDIGEVLRTYAAAGVVKVFGMHHETEAAHAATALRWATGERAAVVTSIGPGALQAMAGSLASSSDGIGVWHIYGDETTHDEGPNLQQIPRPEQHLFLRLAAALGAAYVVHTPEAIGTALRRGANTVDHPHRAGPFFLLLPINVQPSILHGFNLRELPIGAPPRLGAASDVGGYEKALDVLANSARVVVRVGRGAIHAGNEVTALLDLVDGVAVVSPAIQGVIPFAHPRNMTVGGSKGSISGNFAMREADTLVVIGSRSVCQSDCSRTGFPNVRHVININTDIDAAMHYADTVALIGDAAETLRILNRRIRDSGRLVPQVPSPWLKACQSERERWERYKAARVAQASAVDLVWEQEVLTQPAAIAATLDWARSKDATVFVDSGDVQAYAFQLCKDDVYGRTFNETGASYMGFAPSAIFATAMAKESFYGVAICGDGSFVMSPQILVDGVEHGATGCIVVLDNRRMGAISGLQRAQYGNDFATSSRVGIDFVAWAKSVSGVEAYSGGTTIETLTEALDRCHRNRGLSLIHLPVYYGDDPPGSLGTFGGWNVGPWVDDVQRERHRIGLLWESSMV